MPTFPTPTYSTPTFSSPLCAVRRMHAFVGCADANSNVLASAPPRGTIARSHPRVLLCGNNVRTYRSALLRLSRTVRICPIDPGQPPAPGSRILYCRSATSRMYRHSRHARAEFLRRAAAGTVRPPRSTSLDRGVVRHVRDQRTPDPNRHPAFGAYLELLDGRE